MSIHLFLVACVSQKFLTAKPAKDLYLSPWFNKARAVAERHGDAWSVLSAKHGLTDPEAIIEPYDVTLNDLPPIARGQWMERVLVQLRARVQPGDTVTILAGIRYSERLAYELGKMGATVHRPLVGLGIGQQLHALGEMAR